MGTSEAVSTAEEEIMAETVVEPEPETESEVDIEVVKAVAV